MTGKFIVIEGIDGSGKGEQIKRLQNFIFEADKRNIVLTTREPTYGTYGVKIRKHLRESSNPFESASELLELYTKDRKEHLEKVVLPFLSIDLGEIKPFVLCDRYYHSTYAFQQAQDISFEKIKELQKSFLKPSITIVLDIPPEIALSRISINRNSSEKFEKIEFMKILREKYLELKDKLDEKIVVIDGSKSKEEISNEIIKALKREKIIY